MILDASFSFDSQSTFSTTTVSANVIDLSGAGVVPAMAGRDIGAGTALKLLCQTGTAWASTGSATLNIQFQGAPDNGSGSPGTWTTYSESGPIPVASLGGDSRVWQADMPGILAQTFNQRANGTPFPRFVRLSYEVGGATMSAGSITSVLAGTRGTESFQYPVGTPAVWN